VVVPAYNPSYLGSREREVTAQGQPSLKLARPYLKNNLGAWFTPVIPATREAQVWGLWFEVSPGKVSTRPPSKKKKKNAKLKQKDGGMAQVVESLPSRH
jgi:hypothetical protein